ncbi:MAG: putative isomerase [Hyphobacterium sp.]|nr:MAG: putative isomerase [Hyphobacterium sp.]
MMTKIPYAELHSFSESGQPFTGNPAGVCLLESFPDDDVLMGIANSNNLSETAFIVARGEDNWDLRWFTPAVEVDLCGHATFAAGAWLFFNDRVQGKTARFETRSGELKVNALDSDTFAMDLPKVGYKPAADDPSVVEALGAGNPRGTYDIERVHGAKYQMLVFDTEATIAALKPDHGLLRRVGTNVIATAAGKSVDFVSRFFAPASGVDEDPVTGSAHCTLAPFWSDQLQRPRLSARQIGPRSGALDVEPRGNRVVLSGHASPYLEGMIRL